MKKALVVLTALVAFAGLSVSCSIDNDPKINYDPGFLAAVNIDAPEYMVPGNTYSFKLYYFRPTDCYYYNGFYSEQNGNDFTVAVSSIVLNDNCQTLTYAEPEVATFEFECPQSSFQEYVFHFYIGQSQENQAQYSTVTVPVQQ